MDLYSSQERRTTNLSETSGENCNRRKLQMHFTPITFVIFFFFFHQALSHTSSCSSSSSPSNSHSSETSGSPSNPFAERFRLTSSETPLPGKSRINWYVRHEVLSSSRKLKQRNFWATRVNRKYGLFPFWYALTNNAKCPLPVGVRRSKMSVLKLPSVEKLTWFSSSLRLGRWQKMRAIR